MMRALVMCVRYLTQAHANQQTSQQYSSNYSPEVETEKPFKRKRKKKKKRFGRKGLVCIDETAVVESLIDKTAWFENSRMPTWRSWRIPILMT